MDDRMLDPVAEFGDAAPYPVADVPKEYPILVNEEKGIVTVKAGVTVRVLLDYLAVFMYAPYLRACRCSACLLMLLQIQTVLRVAIF